MIYRVVVRDETVPVLTVRRAAQDTILPSDLQPDLW